MRNSVLLIPALTCAALPLPSFAQTISGEISLRNQYVDRDLFVQNNKPTVQGGVYLDIDDHCSLDAWGAGGKTGSELDLGASCRFDLSEKTQLEVWAYRDFLQGFDDITETMVKVRHGGFDISVTQYFWDKNPDATRTEIGYTIEPMQKLEVRPAAVYQTGFGESDIVVGALDITYALNDNVSLSASIFSPLHKGAGDSRKSQVSVGINYTF